MAPVAQPPVSEYVTVCTVDKVAAPIEERLHDVVGFLLAAAPIVSPEGHGAQGNPGDQQP
jgi:hypothetical protein